MLFRRQLPVATGLVAGTLIVAQYYFNLPALAPYAKQMVNWNIILAAFALVLGVGSVVRIHWMKVERRMEGWPYSVVCLATLAIWLFFGLTQGTRGTGYKWLWDNVLLPVSATSYATTFFFVTSAAYRAFRVKSLQAFVLLLSALLVMGRVGVGAVIWPGFQTLSAWIMDIPNTAGMRAVTIGAALSAVAHSVRVIAGLERGHIGGGE